MRDIVCDDRRSTTERLATLAPYSWVWPSDKCVLRCGRVTDGGTDLIQRVRRDGKRVGVWVVDDAAIAERVWNRTDHIVSNVPFDVRDAVQLRQDELTARQTPQNGGAVDATADRTVSAS